MFNEICCREDLPGGSIDRTEAIGNAVVFLVNPLDNGLFIIGFRYDKQDILAVFSQM